MGALRACGHLDFEDFDSDPDDSSSQGSSTPELEVRIQQICGKRQRSMDTMAFPARVSERPMMDGVPCGQDDMDPVSITFSLDISVLLPCGILCIVNRTTGLSFVICHASSTLDRGYRMSILTEHAYL